MPSRDALQLLLDGLQTFIREHLALARVEMKQDLRAMGKDLAVSAAGAPGLIAGYLLLMAAIALLLAKWLPLWAAFGLVAVVNLAGGASLTYRGARRAMSNGMDLHGTAEVQQIDVRQYQHCHRGHDVTIGRRRSPAAGPCGTSHRTDQAPQIIFLSPRATVRTLRACWTDRGGEEWPTTSSRSSVPA